MKKIEYKFKDPEKKNYDRFNGLIFLYIPRQAEKNMLGSNDILMELGHLRIIYECACVFKGLGNQDFFFLIIFNFIEVRS